MVNVEALKKIKIIFVNVDTGVLKNILVIKVINNLEMFKQVKIEMCDTIKMLFTQVKSVFLNEKISNRKNLWRQF